MNPWWHYTIGFREFGHCTFVAFRGPSPLHLIATFGTWPGEHTEMWLGVPEPTIRLVGRCTGDGERSGEPGELESILRSLPWKRLVLARDPTGLQTFVTAIK